MVTVTLQEAWHQLPPYQEFANMRPTRAIQMLQIPGDMDLQGTTMYVSGISCKGLLLTQHSMQSSRDDRREREPRDRDYHRGGDRGERRRSRSPGHRSSRSSRREIEVDSYSSSRDYRAREREDRYTGGHGREDRGWDRDRGHRGGRDDRGDKGDRGDREMSRRDARRDDDDRPPRRDRDLFEGRGDRGRGGRRNDRSDRDEFAMQMGGGKRNKSASPPPKKKEPTPDLTDTIPITERKRRLTQWDIKPPGYENVTAEQAKLSGKRLDRSFSI